MPTFPVSQAFALALQRHQAGQLANAETFCRQVLALEPAHAGAWYLLGIIAQQTGQIDLAIRLLRKAIACRPNVPEVHYHLGNLLKDQGRFCEAADAYRRETELQPGFVPAYNNLGNALRELNDPEGAGHAYDQALKLRPDDADAHFNLANVLREQGRLDEAIDAYRGALRLQPASDAWCNLGVTLTKRGEHEEAIFAYRRALELEPTAAATLSNLICALEFGPDGDEQAAHEEKTRWNYLFVDPLRSSWRPRNNIPDPARRLRIGYVSSRFRSNAVAYFLTPLLEAHDHTACEIFCYASVRWPDAATERLRRSADTWRDVRALPDEHLANLVRQDGIDILVDLSMHSGDNRLPLFAHRPAPVQVSWLAYPGSTGVETMDYRLTDGHIEPPGETESSAGEMAVRLPDVWCCYQPIEEFPFVGPLPASQNGYVTFGSANRFEKIHEALLQCWAKLLAAVPHSHLRLICPAGQAAARTRALFSDHGVTPGRIELIPPCPWPEYLRFLSEADIALDTFPCNGMTTTCHALWMGLPVVTRAGTRAVSRAGQSLLHAVGLPEFVAHSEEDYLRIAQQWAEDPPRLAALRATLRSRMEASPLMDAPRFARQMEGAFRTMWRQWCKEATPPAS